MTDYMKKGLKGFSLIFFMTIVGAILGYLFRMVLARNLTIEEYGIFFSIYAILSLVFLFRDLGLGAAMYKFIPEFIIKKNKKHLKFTVFFSAGTTFFVSIILALITAGLSGVIADFYLKAPLTDSVVVIMAVVFFFFALDAYMLNFFVAFQKHFLYSLFQFLRQLFALLFLILFFIYSKSLFVPMFAYLLTSIMLLVLFFIVATPTLKPLKRIKLNYNKELSSKLSKFGLAAIIIGVGGLILQFTDTIILTFFESSTQVGLYNAALPIANLLLYFGSALTIVLVPMASELWIKNSKKELKTGLDLIFKYSYMLIIPFCFIVLAFSELILQILFSQEYIFAANALKILVFGTFFFFIAQINFNIFSAMGKPQITAKLTIVGGVLNVALNLVLIPLYGILGAAIATSIGYLSMAILSTKNIKQLIQYSVSFKSLITSIIFSLLMLVLIIFLKKIIYMNVYFESIIILIVAGSFYVALAFLFKQINIKEIKELITKTLKK